MPESHSFLSQIDSSDDLKRVSLSSLHTVAAEIRELIIETVSTNGGHLSSSLGVTDLTVALHYVFSTPKDKIVWDVGHQAYAHKILTGRRESFSSLRESGGLNGFTQREESESDAFISGHAGTAISAALGLAVARDALGGDESIMAIVGDGSLSCGISQEALNNVSVSTKRFIIILNDNRMSISANVGAMTRYLNRLISNKLYNGIKSVAKRCLRPVDPGDHVRFFVRRIEESLKRMIVPTVLFEEFGIRYIGPVDGHDIQDLIHTFERVKHFDRPVIIHVVTTKGKGYLPAETQPEKFHGIGKFDRKNGQSAPSTLSFSSVFGASMIELAAQHPEVRAITAAMCSGTGLRPFMQKYPERIIDVGIAEEHAVVFSAGLAAGGLRPFVALYCTFLQRAFDPLFHDVCLQNLPVVFCCDRAGAVDDGPTHHGIQDLGFLLSMPNLAILQPKNETELRMMLFAAYEKAVPTVIRYPRGGSGFPFEFEGRIDALEWGKSETLREGKDAVIYGLGREAYTALEAAEILAQGGIECAVVNVRFLAPFDSEHLTRLKGPFFTVENHMTEGGLATLISRELAKTGHQGRLSASFGWPKAVIPHGSTVELRRRFGLTAPQIAEVIAKQLH